MRKSYLLVIAFILLTSSLYASKSATDKGSKIIKLNAFVLHQAGDLYDVGNDGQTTISFAPSFLFFTSKGVYLGPEVVFNNYNSNRSKMTQLGVGPQLGFILNPKTADEQKDKYMMYYFALSAKFLRTETEEESYYYDYYYGYPYYYTYEVESNRVSLGTSLGMYNMISSKLAIDINVNISVDFDNRTGSSKDETGYSFLIGFGLAGFSF